MKKLEFAELFDLIYALDYWLREDMLLKSVNIKRIEKLKQKLILIAKGVRKNG